MIQRDYYALIAVLLISIIAYSGYQSCNDVRLFGIDTVESIRLIDRPYTIRDTIRVNKVKVLYNDRYIVTDSIPCDTSFIVTSDTIITNTHDTVNIGFNYINDSAFFSLHMRPAKDTLVTQTITIPHPTYDYSHLIGTFSIGILLGILAGTSR
jgi:hypothetical protein